MQAMTILPCVSFSSLNCLTAHCRQAPTEPSAGCQQKYGRSKPSDRQAAAGSACGSASIGLCRRCRSSPCSVTSTDSVRSWMCRSKSSRKILQRALQRLHRRPGPGRRRCARCPADCVCCSSISRSSGRPCPASIARRICSTQGRPSRQGVHQPQDSWAKKCSRLRQHAHRAGAVVEHDHGAGAQPAAGLHRPSRNPWATSRCSLGRENRSRRRRAARRERRKPSRMPPACSSRISRSGGAHRQFPRAGLFDPAAGAVDLGAAVLGAAQSAGTTRRRGRRCAERCRASRRCSRRSACPTGRYACG